MMKFGKLKFGLWNIRWRIFVVSLADAHNEMTEITSIRCDLTQQNGTFSTVQMDLSAHTNTKTCQLYIIISVLLTIESVFGCDIDWCASFMQRERENLGYFSLLRVLKSNAIRSGFVKNIQTHFTMLLLVTLCRLEADCRAFYCFMR